MARITEGCETASVGAVISPFGTFEVFLGTDGHRPPLQVLAEV
jgi:hypothetical protein